MAEATVEVLTAEVRALMVGSRQVTLSVYKQLDEVGRDEIEPFGRVRSGKAMHGDVELVGRDAAGSLVRATVYGPATREEEVRSWLSFDYEVAWRQRAGIRKLHIEWHGRTTATYAVSEGWAFPYGDDEKVRDAIDKAEESLVRQHEEIQRYESLPLIVLAGLR